MRVPAVCDNCGRIFQSGFEVSNATNITFAGCASGPCPFCGGNGHIPDGVYNFIGNTIEFLSGPSRSVTELQRLADILKQARDEQLSLDIIGDRVKKELPELSSLSDLLPKSRRELYAFIGIILTIITLILTQANTKSESKVEVNQVVNIICEQGAEIQLQNKISKKIDKNNLLPKKTQKKVGRNDPCLCGSGKKFKKCCLQK